MSQAEAILAHLQSGKSLTPLEALERFNCLRLAARIDDLRHEGHEIVTVTVREGRKSWASYRLRPVQRELFEAHQVSL